MVLNVHLCTALQHWSSMPLNYKKKIHFILPMEKKCKGFSKYNEHAKVLDLLNYETFRVSEKVPSCLWTTFVLQGYTRICFLTTAEWTMGEHRWSGMRKVTRWASQDLLKQILSDSDRLVSEVYWSHIWHAFQVPLKSSTQLHTASK